MNKWMNGSETLLNAIQNNAYVTSVETNVLGIICFA